MPYLNLLHRVHDDHILQVLACAIEPIVERRRALREVQVQLVDLLRQSLRLQRLVLFRLESSIERKVFV